MLAPAPVIAADAGLGLPAATVTRGGVPARRDRHHALASAGAARAARDRSLLDSLEADVIAARQRGERPAGLRVSQQRCRPASHWVRLRVDGTDSVLLDRTGPAPVFDPTQQITVPP